jgi:hypothetical protein
LKEPIIGMKEKFNGSCSATFEKELYPVPLAQGGGYMPKVASKDPGTPGGKEVDERTS